MKKYILLKGKKNLKNFPAGLTRANVVACFEADNERERQQLTMMAMFGPNLTSSVNSDDTHLYVFFRTHYIYFISFFLIVAGRYYTAALAVKHFLCPPTPAILLPLVCLTSPFGYVLTMVDD